MKPLPSPAFYFPVRPRYEVTPALRPFGTDFGNGAADAHAFQLDREFPRFRASKLAARAERLGKYYLVGDYPAEAERAVHRLIVERLCGEHPDHFTLDRSTGGLEFGCGLTGERPAFSHDWEWRGGAGAAGNVPYVSGLDALAAQVQEDFAVTMTDGAGRDWLAAVHVCNPSGWIPEEKIGLRFAQVHAPVPGMERVLATAEPLVRATVERGPFVRFVWTIVGEDRLNHHPEPPPDVAPTDWERRAFRPEQDPPFYFRVERQVLWGLPEVGACLFLIRPYHYDPRPLRADLEQRALLASALGSMSPEALEYKGLTGYSRALLDWLESGSGSGSGSTRSHS